MAVYSTLSGAPRRYYASPLQQAEERTRPGEPSIACRNGRRAGKKKRGTNANMNKSDILRKRTPEAEQLEEEGTGKKRMKIKLKQMKRDHKGSMKKERWRKGMKERGKDI